MKTLSPAFLCSLVVLLCTSFNPPGDWTKVEQVDKYEMGGDNNIIHNGRSVMTIKSIYKNKDAVGALCKSIPVGVYLGKRIRMTGYIKLKNVTGGAGFYLRTDPAVKGLRPLSIDNMMDERAPKGTADWNKYQLLLDVSDSTAKITFGAWLIGEGQMWFDENIEFEVVGDGIPATGVNNVPVPLSRLKLVTQSFLDSTRLLTKGDKKLRAAYLTLQYDFNNMDSVEWIYSEVKIPRSEAPVHTYYSALGGNGFYSGIQTNSEKERRIIFSVWDAKHGNNNKNLVPDSARTVLLTADKNVFVDRFGNEGSGVHTHLIYNWKEDSTYKFLVHVLPDWIEQSTTVTCFVDMDGQWKMIAKIKRPVFEGYPMYAYSFLENFGVNDDKHRRSASYGNTWVRTVNGSWEEITKAMYYLPFKDENRKIKDYGCGLSDNFGFMLSSGGGFTGTYIAAPAYVKRRGKGIAPSTVMPE